MEDIYVALLVVGGLLYLLFNQRRRRSKPYNPMFRKKPQLVVDYAAQQLSLTMKANYKKKKLMNHGEYRVFKIVDGELKQRGQGRRVFAQTSMGEILSADNGAYETINSKRIDILVIDAFGNPEVAIEHQGLGHHQGNAAARDAVKKEALRKAGIPLIETFDTDSDEDVRRKIFPALGWQSSTTAQPTP